MARTSKNLRETHIIDPACSERMLAMSDTALAPLARACVSLAGVSRLCREYRIGRRNPPYHVVLCTLAGRGVLRLEEGECSLAKGSLACLPAGASYEYRLDGSEWTILWFHLRRRKRWLAFENRGVRVEAHRFFAHLRSHTEAILDESLSGARDARRAVELHAELAALHLDRTLAGETSPVAARHEEALRALWTKVDATLWERWSVARLARKMHMAPGHLHRIVLDIHGETPMAFVAGMRMRRAESLLRRGGMTVTEVAERVGYSDAFAFSTAFKRWKGVPPSRVAREE